MTVIAFFKFVTSLVSQASLGMKGEVASAWSVTPLLQMKVVLPPRKTNDTMWLVGASRDQVDLREKAPFPGLFYEAMGSAT
jgi:hypothetical protein